MGNPHCVIFVDDVDQVPVDKYGPAIENHPLFPNRINVEFVEVSPPPKSGSAPGSGAPGKPSPAALAPRR